jgi:RNA polymerase sigma factor (sigma-70 family)
MDEQDRPAERFEEHRPYLLGVAFRMLGSVQEAEDAVQEAWLRLSRADPIGVENLRGWLTTVIGRVCLDMLRSRASRREQSLDVHLPDPIVSAAGGIEPEQEALLAESVGVALYVVLETLAPAERLAFVLHDAFAVSFEEIGAILGRTANAAKQLASRARRRVQGAGAVPDADLGRQHAVVDAFFAAARQGDFAALVSLLDPNATLQADGGAAHLGVSAVVRGAAEVASRARMGAQPAARVHRALVNGAAGVVITVNDRPVSVMGFTVIEGVIVAIHAFTDPDRLSRLDLPDYRGA